MLVTLEPSLPLALYVFQRAYTPSSARICGIDTAPTQNPVRGQEPLCPAHTRPMTLFGSGLIAGCWLLSINFRFAPCTLLHALCANQRSGPRAGGRRPKKAKGGMSMPREREHSEDQSFGLCPARADPISPRRWTLASAQTGTLGSSPPH